MYICIYIYIQIKLSHELQQDIHIWNYACWSDDTTDEAYVMNMHAIRHACQMMQMTPLPPAKQSACHMCTYQYTRIRIVFSCICIYTYICMSWYIINIHIYRCILLKQYKCTSLAAEDIRVWSGCKVGSMKS